MGLDIFQVIIPLVRAAASLAAVLGLASLSMRLRGRGRPRLARRGSIGTIIAAARFSFRDGRDGALSLGPLSAASPLALASAFMISAAVPLLSGIDFGAALPAMPIYRQGSGLVFSLAMVSLWALFLFLARHELSSTGVCRGSQGVASTHLSCFLSMCLAAGSLLMLTSTADIAGIVEGQTASPLGWNALRQPAAFVIFFVAMCASVEAPSMGGLDFKSSAGGPQAVSQTGLKAALSTLSGHVAIASLALVSAALFLGGYQTPFSGPVSAALAPLVSEASVQTIVAALGAAAILIKAAAILWCASWLGSNMARIRADRFFSLGLRIMLPLAIVNMAATALLALR